MNIFSEIGASRTDLAASYPELAMYRRLEGVLSTVCYFENKLGIDPVLASRYPEAQEAKAKLREWISQLDKNHIIPHITKGVTSEARNYLNSLGRKADYVYRFFGVKPEKRYVDADEQLLIEKLQSTCRGMRKMRSVQRLEVAISERAAQGWYCLFETLTVRPEHIEEVFGKDHREFSRYIQRVERSIGREIYGTIRKAEEEKRNDGPYRS